MDISEFIKDDTKELISLWKSCGLTSPQNDPEKDIKRKMEVNPELFLVGKIDDRIVASVMGGYEGHRGWINYLAVDQKYRKSGFGRMIMEEIEKRLIKKGCPKINLQVRNSNTTVMDFYRAIGFAEDEVVSFGKRLKED